MAVLSDGSERGNVPHASSSARHDPRPPPEAFEVDAVHRTGDSGAVAAVGRLASGIDCLGLGECLRIPLEAVELRLCVCVELYSNDQRPKWSARGGTSDHRSLNRINGVRFGI